MARPVGLGLPARCRVTAPDLLVAPRGLDAPFPPHGCDACGGKMLIPRRPGRPPPSPGLNAEVRAFGAVDGCAGRRGGPAGVSKEQTAFTIPKRMPILLGSSARSAPGCDDGTFGRRRRRCRTDAVAVRGGARRDADRGQGNGARQRRRWRETWTGSRWLSARRKARGRAGMPRALTLSGRASEATRWPAAMTTGAAGARAPRGRLGPAALRPHTQLYAGSTGSRGYPASVATWAPSRPASRP